MLLRMFRVYPHVGSFISCSLAFRTKLHQVLGEHPKGCQEETLFHVLSGDRGSNQYLWMVYASVLPDLFEKKQVWIWFIHETIVV